MKNKKIGINNALVMISIAAIVLVCIYGISKNINESGDISSNTGSESAQEDRHYLNEHITAEFQPVIIDKFNDESKLIVQNMEAEVSVTLSNEAFMDWNALKKSQTLTYKGKGSFAIDLSLLGSQNIQLNNEKRKIIISVPKPQLEPIEIDPDAFETTETTSGILAFGKMKFTAQQYNDLEKEVKAKLTNALDTDKNHSIADAAAIEEMTKIFEPVVQTVDSSYSVEINFVN